MFAIESYRLSRCLSVVFMVVRFVQFFSCCIQNMDKNNNKREVKYSMKSSRVLRSSHIYCFETWYILAEVKLIYFTRCQRFGTSK